MSNPRPFGGRWVVPQHLRPITPGERETLLAVAAFVARHPYPPTIRDVARARGVTVNTARERLDALVVKGYIDRYPGRVRAMWITEKGREECLVTEQAAE